MTANAQTVGRRTSAPLDAWIDDAIDFKPDHAVRPRLRNDTEAFNNELPWSNGQAKGQFNRLQALKCDV